MIDCEIAYTVRHKENKTDAELLMLQYRDMLCLISEVLVDESKCHICSDKALKEIREILNGKGDIK